MQNALTVREEKQRILVVYIPSRNYMDGLRTFEIGILKKEIRALDAIPACSIITNPVQLDVLTKKFGAEALIVRAHGRRLSEFRAVWVAGAGSCEFVRDIVRIAFSSRVSLPVVDKTPSGSPLGRLVAMRHRHMEAHKTNSLFTSLWVGQ